MGVHVEGLHCLLVHQMFTALNQPGGTRHAEMIARLGSHGWRFTVVTAPFAYLTGDRSSTLADPFMNNVSVVRAWSPSGLGRSFVGRVIGFLCFMLTSFVRALRTPGVDVVWGTVPSTFQGVSAGLVAKLRRKPFLLEVRDLWPDFAVAARVLTNPILIASGRWLEARLYRSADRIVVNSPGFLDHVASKGVPRDRITLIPNGVEAAGFLDAGGARYRNEWATGGSFIALYAGAHGAANDLVTVLNAAEHLRDEPRIRIVLVGAGREKAALIADAERRALDNVLFAEPVAKQEMPEVLAASDVCLATLRDAPEFASTYPNKVFDYMAACRPTIVGIDGPIREVIEASHGGTFVPPGDPEALANAIRAYGQDPARCQAEGLAARMYVTEHFDRGKQADQLARLFRELVRVKD